MHKEQKIFCESVKSLFPYYFTDVEVIDAGSMDINGNNRYLFSNYRYTGVDIILGKNVDVVCNIHEFDPIREPDIIISTEMLEHDKYWKQSISHMYDMVRAGGLLLITCATTGRKEHGTHHHNEMDSPATLSYYRNISRQMFENRIADLPFEVYSLQENKNTHDLYFWGIKI